MRASCRNGRTWLRRPPDLILSTRWRRSRTIPRSMISRCASPWRPTASTSARSSSKKTHARRVERLVASEIEPAALARLRAPIELDIGASSPAEIAVSALGEFAGRMASKRHGLRFEGRPLARGKIQRADEQIAYLAVTATPEGSQAGA